MDLIASIITLGFDTEIKYDNLFKCLNNDQLHNNKIFIIKDISKMDYDLEKIKILELPRAEYLYNGL
jgi:hypothetical protein